MIQKSTIIKGKSLFLLTVFILLKINIAHAISHAFSHDDLVDCEHCILIIDSNKTKAFDGNTYLYSNDNIVTTFLLKPLTLLYKKPSIRNHHAHFFFNKPPPSL